MSIRWAKLSKQNIIDIGKERFGDQFLYNNINTDNIKNVRSKISITCNICNTNFISTIENHFIAKKRCRKCAMKNVAKTKQKSGIELFKILDNKFKNHNFESVKLYDKLSKKDEIIFFCNNHNKPLVFKRLLGTLLQGYGCFICTNSNIINSFIFKHMGTLVHNNKYKYSLVVDEYFNKKSHSILPIICKKHGVFKQTYNNHINGKKGCNKCGIEKNSKQRKITIKDIIQKISSDNFHSKFSYKELFNLGDLYIKNSKQKIPVLCKLHNFTFYPTIDQHFSKKSDCPKCSKRISKKESQWLNSLNIKEENRQISLPGLPKRWKVDGYDPKTNTVYEFYGDYWHGNPKVYDQKLIHPARKETYGKLYEKTKNKEKIIKLAGYNLIIMWELDYKTLVNN